MPVEYTWFCNLGEKLSFWCEWYHSEITSHDASNRQFYFVRLRFISENGNFISFLMKNYLRKHLTGKVVETFHCFLIFFNAIYTQTYHKNIV